MLRPLLFLILLCSCVSQRKAEKFFDANPDKLGKYLEQKEVWKEPIGDGFASSRLPIRLYAPSIQSKPRLRVERINLQPIINLKPTPILPPGYLNCEACKPSTVYKTVYQQDTILVHDLRLALKQEQNAHLETRYNLRKTTIQRDYWQEMNEKKFWTLIAMAVFALLYILFRLLGSSVQEEDA